MRSFENELDFFIVYPIRNKIETEQDLAALEQVQWRRDSGQTAFITINITEQEVKQWLEQVAKALITYPLPYK